MKTKTLSLLNLVGCPECPTPIGNFLEMQSVTFLDTLFEIDDVLYEALVIQNNLVNISPLIIEINKQNPTNWNAYYAIGCDFETLQESNDVINKKELFVKDALYFSMNLDEPDNYGVELEQFEEEYKQTDLTINNIDTIYVVYSRDVFSEGNCEIEYYLELK